VVITLLAIMFRMQQISALGAAAVVLVRKKDWYLRVKQKKTAREGCDADVLY